MSFWTRTVPRTYIVCLMAVVLAYSPFVAIGYWGQNVLAILTNVICAGILAILLLLADRSRTPMVVKASVIT